MEKKIVYFLKMILIVLKNQYSNKIIFYFNNVIINIIYIVKNIYII